MIPARYKLLVCAVIVMIFVGAGCKDNGSVPVVSGTDNLNNRVETTENFDMLENGNSDMADGMPVEIVDLFCENGTLFCMQSDNTLCTIDSDSFCRSKYYTFPTDCMARIENVIYYVDGSEIYAVNVIDRSTQKITNCPDVNNPGLEYIYRLEQASPFLILYEITLDDNLLDKSNIWIFNVNNLVWQFVCTESEEINYNFLGSDGSKLFFSSVCSGENPSGQFGYFDCATDVFISICSFDDVTVSEIISAVGFDGKVYYTTNWQIGIQIFDLNSRRTTTIDTIVGGGQGEDFCESKFQLISALQGSGFLVMCYNLYNETSTPCYYDIGADSICMLNTTLPVTAVYVVLWADRLFYYDLATRDIKSCDIQGNI